MGAVDFPAEEPEHEAEVSRVPVRAREDSLLPHQISRRSFVSQRRLTEDQKDRPFRPVDQDTGHEGVFDFTPYALEGFLSDLDRKPFRTFLEGALRDAGHVPSQVGCSPLVGHRAADAEFDLVADPWHVLVVHVEAGCDVAGLEQNGELDHGRDVGFLDGSGPFRAGLFGDDEQRTRSCLQAEEPLHARPFAAPYE
ncbi:hypothetical protein [Paractinoplanes globisporus]|uniref:Uncharacterized protein n=1 Tax=Paractinoplanes globisporus TaxID=113565 RepID=A0ABW6WFI5_9ACTN|nr:hypothetical protein [Actinoplanes globisporus]